MTHSLGFVMRVLRWLQWFLWINLLGLWPLPVWAAHERELSCLLKAYPAFLSDKTDVRSNILIWQDGETMRYDDGVEPVDFETRLNQADLKEQMRIAYPLGNLAQPPALNHDPGRARYQPFFEKMYGDSASAVRAQLTAVWWEPGKQSVTFSQANNAHLALAAVGKKMAEQADLIDYAQLSLGTFNWRLIQGTNRQSNHSFGIAIDFKLPSHLHQYWRWRCQPKQPCGYPDAVLHDEKLQRVVGLFEQQGFIWGGKWYHYDTMHFEYRPELIACGITN